MDDDGARATPKQMTRQHVFVINGSPGFLDLMRELLQQEAFNVTTTNFVPQTFEQIESAKPALLIVDLAVGEQAGWDLLMDLRTAAATRNIPVIVVSTNRRLLGQARQHRAILGGDRYLLKPFHLEDLLRVVAEMIGSA